MEKVVTIPQVGHSEYITASRCIHKGPCIVKAVHVGCCGGADYCRVYDGESNLGKLKAYIALKDGDSYTWRPGDGTDFDYGIYIDVHGTTLHVTVTYTPESWKAFI